MKNIFKLILVLFPFIFSSCEKTMDEIAEEKNDAVNMESSYILSDVLLKSAFESTGTDLAWYATVYAEHSAGTWAQSADADRRIGQDQSSLVNNSWNSIYYVMNECKIILDKTDPNSGNESSQFGIRGVAQVMMAYNLAITTDMWGDVPYNEAFQGGIIKQPKYDSQQSIYNQIFALLDDAIINLGKTSPSFAASDFIYAGDKIKWLKAAYSLKARYLMRTLKRDASAPSKALQAISNGFTAASQQLLFNKFNSNATAQNPWFQFMADRTHLSVSSTLYDLMNDRNDPRMSAYFTLINGVVVPAPIGEAVEAQGGIYSQSNVSVNNAAAPIPLMSYHELKFIEAEAKYRTNDPSWSTSLEQAISASFVYNGLTIGNYFTDVVQPRLTSGNELQEIMTQKYIAMYEYEAMEAYNDYRRTGMPTMHNPNNSTIGFVQRFPYALSEVSSNGANVPQINVFTNKVWWAQ